MVATKPFTREIPQTKAPLPITDSITLLGVFGPMSASCLDWIGCSINWRGLGRCAMKLSFAPYFAFWGVLAVLLIALGNPRDKYANGPGHDRVSALRPTAELLRELHPGACTRDPDFGARIVRVPDANTLAGLPGRENSLAGISFHTDSSGEQNEWSVFDSTAGEHGEYGFWVVGTDGVSVLFSLDPVTMHVNPVTTGHGRHPPSPDQAKPFAVCWQFQLQKSPCHLRYWWNSGVAI
jgi:hypothetical protein